MIERVGFELRLTQREVDALRSTVEGQGDERPESVRAAAALAEARNLRGQVSLLIRALVVQARHDGLSWAQIGDALGITRQAAHHYYEKRGDADWAARDAVNSD